MPVLPSLVPLLSTASVLSSPTKAGSSPCPRSPTKNTVRPSYNDTFHAITAEARTALVEAVNTAYEQKLREQQEQNSQQAMSQQM